MKPMVLKLQCGHDPKAVEMAELTGDRVSRAARTLQCGHDPKAVENSASWAARRRLAGLTLFNAATTRRPWRTSSPHWQVGQPAAGLQCGHDPKAVENARAWGRARLEAPSASMRPRPEGRGEPPWRAPQADRAALKRFNAATTRRPWRTRRLNAPIRMTFPNARASMRPRPEGRGELWLADSEDAWMDPCFNAATTRRPWRTTKTGGGESPTLSRFNAATTRRPWRTGSRRTPGDSVRMLQCGHDPKAVENLPSRARRRSRDPMLQCGHDPKAVENPGDGEGAGRHTGGFNAATTRRPWRIRRRGVGSLRRHWRSMRPRPEGRGEPPRRTRIRFTSFNAATTRRPWRTARPGDLRRPATCFNAATTRRPWKMST